MIRAFLVLQLISSLAWATPVRVMIIRHAEKPVQKSDHLSPRGCQRALALKDVFTTNPGLRRFGDPVGLFATKYIPGRTSRRSIDTLEPLAQNLNLKIDSSFEKDEYKKLAKKILNSKVFNNQPVLIAWTHSTIPELASALGALVPKSWHDDVYDRVWVVDFLANGQIVFADRPQALLPGDSN